jgi:superfamily II DNA or RNA helicase
MRITFHGLYGTLSWQKAEFSLFHRLRDSFSVLDPNRFLVEAFRRGWWDGKEHVISKDGKFLRGMASAIVKEVRSLGGEVEDYVPYNREWITRNAPYVYLADKLHLEGITLAEHQRRMTRALLKHGGGTVEGVTGCGKTESITLLARILSEFTERIFFIVHRIGLMRAARDRVAERCPELGPLCGLLGDGERPKESDRFIFSTVQSLSKVLGIGKNKAKDKELEKAWKEAGAIIIDEAHRVAGETYLKVLSKAPEVPIYQFSGTPEVDDPIKDWAIVGVGGPIVTRVKRSEMEAIGFIAEAVACVREFTRRADEIPGRSRKRKILWMPKKEKESYTVTALRVEKDGNFTSCQLTVDPSKGIKTEEDEYYLYPGYGRDMVLLEKGRNADIANFVRASLSDERQPLLLCERVAQTYYLRNILVEEGLRREQIGLVHGTHDVEERRETVSAFENGTKPVLIASAIFDEGEDIKEVGSVVLAAGGASLVKVVQRIGRGVRAKAAETGNYIPIWFPLDALTEFSREHTIARVSYLQRAEITIEENTGDWPSFFRFLREKYGKNLTRVA